jgi:hypothetical protein
MKKNNTIGKPDVVNRHRVDADPDPTFHFDADPDPVRILPKFYTYWNIKRKLFFYSEHDADSTGFGSGSTIMQKTTDTFVTTVTTRALHELHYKTKTGWIMIYGKYGTDQVCNIG